MLEIWRSKGVRANKKVSWSAEGNAARWKVKYREAPENKTTRQRIKYRKALEDKTAR